MQFTTLLLAIFPAAIMASPVETNSNADVTAQFWSSDLCDRPVDSVTLIGSGSYRCISVSNKRSISVPSLK
jgi:protein involved in temperature-dependent protein secretion